ncbi:MAG: T9SS type A sorting domain-containing protein [Flavobacteriales bacterium]
MPMRTNPLAILLIFSFFLGSAKLRAQQWVERLQDPSVPFDTVQRSFEGYWKGETGPGWKQFKRWEYFVEPRIGPKRRRMPASARWKAWKKEKRNKRGSRVSGGDWDYIGNDSIPLYGGAGRINCIAFHPKDQTTIYAGAASGGLWKSTDDGATWTPMTDQQPVLGVSQILIHPSDPDTMYLATGDGDGSDTYSVGVLKSLDGGNTWSKVGWNLTQADNIRIHHMVMNEEDPRTLLASTDNGLYKSLNGGNDWYQVASGRYGDIAYHPTDTSIVYAYYSGSSTFMRSNDGGQSFSSISNGTPDPANIGRIEIAVSQDDPSRVYFVAGDASTQGFYGFYRSDDAGQSFAMTIDTPNVLGYSPDGSGSGGQAWYDLAIAAHPQDADQVFTGGINVWHSTNGGYDFSIRTHWWGAQNLPEVHADCHYLGFDRNGRLWAGNDGGVFRSPDLGNQWDDLSHGLHIAQIYRLGQSATDPGLILTGWQDNGTNRKNGPSSWSRVIGGDGMECIISHSDPSLMYGSLYYGRIYRSTDQGNSFNAIVYSDSNGVHEGGGWVTPYMMDPLNSDELIIGKKELYKSIDGGSSWYQMNSTSLGSGNFRSLAQCRAYPDHIYAAKASELWKKDGSGASFQSKDAGLPVGQVTITHVEAHRTDPDKAWVTFSGYQAQEKVYFTNDGGNTWENRSQGLPNVPVNCVVHEAFSPQRVYVGTDLGVYYRDSSMAQFEPFNSGLPNVIVNELAVHEGSGMLRAATYGRGLWESELRGDEPSSILRSSQNGGLKLYPNPSNGWLNGKVEGDPGDFEVLVQDASGREVHRSSLEGGRKRFHLDLRHLETGLYILRFKMEEGVLTRKVMLR